MATLSVRAQLILAAAALAVPTAALAGAVNDTGYAPSEGTQFFISTSGATALGRFTRANTGSPTTTPNPDVALTRSTFALGTPDLRIGHTRYDRTAIVGQFIGNSNATTPGSNEPGPNNDRFVYQYLERGSVNGLLDLVRSNGMFIGVAATNPPAPTNTQPLWLNGSYFGATTTSNRNFTNTAPYQPQGAIRIAWSDVRFQQGFSVNEGTLSSQTKSPNRKTTEQGFGLGKGNVGGTNFQRLAASENINGGVGSSTYFRNETLAVVPFNLIANPGTGLTRISKDEGKWIQGTGRLANGANFNSATRDIGSGTRNQGALNFGIDPSWAAGERDRTNLGSAYSMADPSGSGTVTINTGDEAHPERSILNGANSVGIGERRTGPLIRFSDKGGGSILREAVFSSRMGIGVLSGGDSRSNTNGNALTTATAAPARALAIDFGYGSGTQDFRQATAQNVTDGKYDLWSATQAITVSGTVDPDGSGPLTGSLVSTSSNTANTVLNDTDDEFGVTPSSGTLTHSGIHRKFLDNITTSVASDFGSAETVRTPAEEIVNAGFIIPQIMKITKAYDGEATSPRSLSNDPPSGGGLSDATLYQQLIGDGDSNLITDNAWVNPASQTGLGSGDVRYNLFASANTSASTNANADVSIRITSRNTLAGDMNFDGVRDLADAANLAKAYANPQAFAASQTGSAALDSGTVVLKTGGLVTVPGATATEQLINANLVVLTDFNANGNLAVGASTVTLNGTEGTAGRVVERADIRFFLWGGAIDTSAYNSATTMFLNGSTVSLTAAQNRMENGVRLGSLKKVQAIQDFNNSLSGLAGTTINPGTGTFYTSTEINDMKFSKFDVNGSDQLVAQSANGHRGLTIADAKMVNDAVGLDYTSFDHVMSTNIDLAAANMNDSDTVVTHIASGGYSDFKDIREALGGYLLDGDANFDGVISSLDFDALAAAYGDTGKKWSDGDFSGFDGKVNTLDFNLLAGNFGLTAPTPGSLPGAVLGSVVPEPASISLMVLGTSALLRRRR